MENIASIVYKHWGKSRSLREGRIHLPMADENLRGESQNDNDKKFGFSLAAEQRAATSLDTGRYSCD
jgi:hypothetical protein